MPEVYTKQTSRKWGDEGKSEVMFNHMFDVAFTLESPNEWEDVTNGEMITALAKRLDALRIELRHSRDLKYIPAFGYSDSYIVADIDKRSHTLDYPDGNALGANCKIKSNAK